MALTPTRTERAIVDPLVSYFLENKRLIVTHQNSLLGYIREYEPLIQCIHSIRHRIKDPKHLRDKLVRKLRKCLENGESFEITPENLFMKVTDLAGIRLLHLHTKQIAEIDKYLKIIVREQPIELFEEPFARTWDDESRSFFTSIGIATQTSDTMYTSVHYVIASDSPSKPTCEIQVRTLMEEVWGEVDHTVNYPHPNKSVACREQIRALARSTSSATRLVDSIFSTVLDLEVQNAKTSRARLKKKIPPKRSPRKRG